MKIKLSIWVLGLSLTMIGCDTITELISPQTEQEAEIVEQIQPEATEMTSKEQDIADGSSLAKVEGSVAGETMDSSEADLAAKKPSATSAATESGVTPDEDALAATELAKKTQLQGLLKRILWFH